MSNHASKLSGKVAVITGGSTGIGLATARLFVAEGAHVYITGRRQAELDAAVREIGDNVVGVRADAANLADLDRLYAEVQRDADRIDVLFANAAVAKLAPLGEISEEHYDREFAINVKGVLFTVQKALPLLVPGASVILNASIVATKGSAAFSVYSATKAAVRSFARTWTTDLKDRRIRVNAISPGPIDTPGLAGVAPDGQADAFRANMAAGVPLGRIGRPEEIARAALFLASDDSSFVTGIELFVDGGVAQV